MANTPQAKKRIRRNASRAAINGARVSRIRTYIKAVESAVSAGNKDDAAKALKAAQPEMARGVARGVMHKNTASRKFSRLTKSVAAWRRNVATRRSKMLTTHPSRRPVLIWLNRSLVDMVATSHHRIAAINQAARPLRLQALLLASKTLDSSPHSALPRRHHRRVPTDKARLEHRVLPELMTDRAPQAPDTLPMTLGHLAWPIALSKTAPRDRMDPLRHACRPPFKL